MIAVTLVDICRHLARALMSTRDMMRDDPGFGAETFIRKLKHYPVLDRDDELRLAILYRDTRDKDAERKLVEGHLRLVVKIARSCCFRASALPDMIQEGVLGLMKAVQKYDPGRGVRLSTYASWWIRAYVYQYVMVNARVMRLVTTFPQRKLFFALRKEQAKLSIEGNPVEPARLAESLGVPLDDVIEMEARLSTREVHLDTSKIDESGHSELKDDRAGPDELVSAQEVQHAIRRKMIALEASLGTRDKMILEQRLAADEPITLQEVGRRCGISRERVRQLEKRLKQRLQTHLRSLTDTSEAGVYEPGNAPDIAA
jgi:RNA polymerase sigma-32 factor